MVNLDSAGPLGTICVVVGDIDLDAVSSGVADALSAANSALNEAADYLSGFNSEAKDNRPGLHRADAAITLGEALIGLADPSITPQPIAAQIQERSEDLRNQLSAAAAGSGGNPDQAAENLLTSLQQIRRPNELLEDAAKKAAARFRQSLAPRVRALLGEVEDLEARVNEANETNASRVSEVNERFNAISEEIAATEERVSGLISDQDAKFTEAQESRRKEFASSLAEAKKQLDVTQAEIEERREKASKRLLEIEQDVADTAAALGGRATAMGHGDESTEQARLAFRWSVTTIALLLLAAAIPLWLGILHAEQSPESVAGKATLALIIAGVAGYAAGIARHHRERAAAARRLELEMNSFSPFVAPLGREDQNDLRSTIIWRFFGPASEPQQPDSAPGPGRGLRELLHLRRSKREAQETPSTGSDQAE